MLGESVAEKISYGGRDGGDFKGSWTIAVGWEWVGGTVVCKRVNDFVKVVRWSRRL